MKKKLFSLLTAFTLAFSLAACSDKKNTSESSSSESSASVSEPAESSETEETTEEETTEAATEHVSPKETVSSTLGSQFDLNKTITHNDGDNTVSVSLSELIEDGDSVSSFTFIIYSGDNSNIGTFKGGCGISVSEDCAAATDKGWYQSADFSSATEGTYGEIRWDVPAEIRDYISAGGEIQFGYWWGSASSIRVETVVCTYTRTREIPVDGTANADVGKSVSYSDTDNSVHIPFSDVMPENSIPQAVTFNISSGGSLGKFTGAFGLDSSEGHYQSGDIAVFTDGSSLSPTWILSEEAKSYAAEDGDLMLGYWSSAQQNITLDSVMVKYSQGSGSAGSSSGSKNNGSTDKKPAAETEKPASDNGDFRTAKQLVAAIKTGWNLGNTLECYNYKDYAKDGETAWGNPKTTPEMIQAVCDAGFNAIRIPVTWGEHLNGDTIDSAWMDRVQEIVDYAYDRDMIVILNMHHDDYTWFRPVESEYSANSAKLCSIWKQICSRFSDYGDRLIFEGMNEPRTVGSAGEWNGGTHEERVVINKYEQDFVNTVRASGGNNAKRALIVTSYAASYVSDAVNDVVIPDDDNIIVSIHYYSPWDFANGDTTQWGSDSDKADLEAGFRTLKEKFADKGTPVIIGEYGATAASSNDVRSNYYEYYISTAAKYGIKCFVWDNNASSGESSFGLLNRKNLTWNQSILDAIMKGSKQ